MTISPIWYGDTLAVQVTVYNNSQSAGPFDLTGATVSCAAMIGGMKYAGTATVQSPATAGIVILSWPLADLPQGNGVVQLRVTSGASVQTVYEDQIMIKPSALP